MSFHPGRRHFLEAEMFDARYYAASDLQEMTDLRRKLVAMQLEKLFELVDARDIELLFFANDTCRPDWRFVDDLSDDAQKNRSRDFRSFPRRLARRERAGIEGEAELMAIASNISIDVDSAAFRAFQEKFDKYKAALDKTLGGWRGVDVVEVRRVLRDDSHVTGLRGDRISDIRRSLSRHERLVEPGRAGQRPGRRRRRTPCPPSRRPAAQAMTGVS
jgi:hypothetical protein